MTEHTCTFPDCTGQMHARGWCPAHYQQWRKTGQVKPLSYAPKGVACYVCGGVVPAGSGSRRYCSEGCRQAHFRLKGQRPKVATCRYCSKDFSLGRDPKGRLQRIDTQWCPDCGRESVDVQRFRRYGVTREQYVAASDRGCQICGTTERKLHIDHDHACCSTAGGHGAATCGGCVRGFICGPCNRGLGLFRDDPDVLLSAADYLRTSKPSLT